MMFEKLCFIFQPIFSIFRKFSWIFEVLLLIFMKYTYLSYNYIFDDFHDFSTFFYSAYLFIL